jgi:hypothetical protein
MEHSISLKGVDLFYMFLPNYLMQTSLQYLLMNDEFELFNKLVAKINDENKEDFTKTSSGYLKKIKEMFYFILENVCSYEMKAIEMTYFKLEYDGAREDLNTISQKNIKVVQTILNEIKSLIFKDFIHDELLYKWKTKKQLKQIPIIDRFNQKH